MANSNQTIHRNESVGHLNHIIKPKLLHVDLSNIIHS